MRRLKAPSMKLERLVVATKMTSDGRDLAEHQERRTGKPLDQPGNEKSLDGTHSSVKFEPAPPAVSLHVYKGDSV